MNSEFRPSRVIAEPVKWLTNRRKMTFAPAIEVASNDGTHKIVVLADDAERLVHEIEDVAEMFGVTCRPRHAPTAPGEDVQELLAPYRAALRDADREIDRLRAAYDDLAMRVTPEADDYAEDTEVPA